MTLCLDADARGWSLVGRGTLPPCDAAARSRACAVGEPWRAQRWKLYGDASASAGAVTAGCLVSEHDAQPALSVSYPVHNRQGIVGRSLRSLLRSTGGVWELVILLDACDDDSEAEVWTALREYTQSGDAQRLAREACACAACCAGLGRDRSGAATATRCAECAGPASVLLSVRVLRATLPLFETTADNLVMASSRPSVAYALVQSDTMLVEAGWNLRLMAALRAHSDLLGMSGRCLTGFEPFANVTVGNCAGTAGGMRHVVSGAWIGASAADGAWALDIGVRSPLLLRASHVQRLGFLDQGRYMLGGDDINLAERGRALHGWMMGYTPVHAYDERGRMDANRSVLWRDGAQRAQSFAGLQAQRAASPPAPSHTRVGALAPAVAAWAHQAEAHAKWRHTMVARRGTASEHAVAAQWRPVADRLPAGCFDAWPSPPPPAPPAPSRPPLPPCNVHTHAEGACERKRRRQEEPHPHPREASGMAPMSSVAAWRELSAQWAGGGESAKWLRAVCGR